MRDIRSGNCPLCDHHEIVEAQPPDFADEQIEVPSVVTADPRWMFSGRNPNDGHGELRIYFCRSCGYAQHFVLAPESVPISEGHKTRLIVGREGGTPFR
ncbi:MAG: hypothetical protein AB7S26_23335 [Sandaracinaceae bacterium]